MDFASNVTGRQFSTFDLLPFLNMGVTIPFFQFVRYLPRCLMFLKILCKEEAIASAVSLKTIGGTLSGPQLFLVVRSLQILAIVLFSMQYSLIVHVCEGIVIVWFESAPFGFTKTDTKYKVFIKKVSLLSIGDSAFTIV